jgi:hypothetical protein
MAARTTPVPPQPPTATVESAKPVDGPIDSTVAGQRARVAGGDPF